MSGVTGLTLGKSKTDRGTGDDLERQKVPHNDKSQLSERLRVLCISYASLQHQYPQRDSFQKQERWFPIGGAV